MTPGRWIRHLPPRAQAWVVDYGGMALMLVAIAFGFAAWLIWFQPEPHSHDGFHRVTVDTTNTISDDSFRLMVYFYLDGAGPFHATTTSLALAQTIVGTACVERRKRASGRATFRLVTAENCDVAGQ